MPLPNWGQLEKSLTDPEKIEEAINRLIQDHNDNPDAHLAEGQSLYSHKMAEIIDHLVASIVADKIKDKEVTIAKWSWDKFFVQCNFESLDGFYQVKEGTGSNIWLELGEAILRCGTASGNQTRLFIEYSKSPQDYQKNPFFQVGAVVDTDALNNTDFGFALGTAKPLYVDPTNANIFGFKYLEADKKMYAFYLNASGVETKQEIPGITLDNRNLYRAELIYNGAKPAGQRETLKFYVNGILKVTFADIECKPGQDQLVGVAIKQNYTPGDNFDLHISNLIYAQDI
jgi:hypothetical protein